MRLRWKKLVHRLTALLLHRSPLRIGGRLDRTTTRLLRPWLPERARASNTPLVYLLVLRLNRLLLGMPKGEFRCPTTLGFDLCIDARSGRHYHLVGCYELGTLDLMSRVLRPGDVFVDAGASVGQMSLHAASQVGDGGAVLAIEPSPDRARKLARSCSWSPHGNRVRMYAVALADRDGEIVLDTNPTSPSVRQGSTRQEADGDPSLLVLQATTLDDLLAREGLATPAMVKLDVEGSELASLLGATRMLEAADPPLVCFEHFDPDYTEAVVDLLRARQSAFRFFILEHGTMTPGQLVPVTSWQSVPHSTNVVAATTSHADRLPELRPWFAEAG